jgi:hypothetical protein
MVSRLIFDCFNKINNGFYVKKFCDPEEITYGPMLAANQSHNGNRCKI